jgi:hypothetical protein
MFPKVIAWSEYRYADERLVFGNDVVQKVKKTTRKHIYLYAGYGRSFWNLPSTVTASFRSSDPVK